MQQASVYRDNFVRELKALMKDLIKVFPEDRNIKLVSSSLNITLMDDPEDSVIKQFYASMNPCEKYIVAEDERLFKDNIIKSNIELFSQIGEYWGKLADENKEAIWKYVKVLYMLSKSFLV